MDNLPPVNPINIVLLGKTGHGKSATANSLFGKNQLFNSRRSSSSVTSRCQKESCIIEGRTVFLVDTPGTMDTKDPDATLEEIGTAIAHRPEGYHAFLLVLRPDQRMTKEEWMAIILLKKMFGEDILLKYTILVFTHWDDILRDDEVEDKSVMGYLRSQGPELWKLVEDCNKRCVWINNKEKDPQILQQQIKEIISMIDRLVNENSRKMYTNELFAFARQKLQEEHEKIKKEEERIAKEKENLLQEVENLKQVNDKLTVSKEESDKERNQKEKELKEKTDELIKEEKELQVKKNNIEPNVGHQVANQAKQNGANCFPPDALVKLQDGRIVAMADLQVGHKILSLGSNMKLEYSEIYFFAHLDPESQSQYICISASGYKLKLTPDHHIFIVGNGNTIDTVPAGNINIGDRILVLNDTTSSLQEELVTHLTRSSEVGVYAPITMSGTIIVDNVLTSCYVDIVPPKISHPLLWPVRKLYQLSPSLSAWMNMDKKEGMPVWVKWIIDSFLRWMK